MRIRISVAKSPDFVGVLKQSNRALAAAINRTLEEGQAAERQAMAGRFIDRRRGFLSRMIKIAPSDRATPDRLRGAVRVVGPEGSEQRAARYLTRHEDPPPESTPGGSYSIDPSVRIKGYFWIPTGVIRPQFSDTVQRKLYPSSLGMTERQDVTGFRRANVHTTSGGYYQIKGKQRTFVLFGANGGAPIGIFQRRGSRKLGGRGRSAGRRVVWQDGGSRVRDDIQLIWAFASRIHLKPRLFFYQTVGDTVRSRIGVNYSGMLASMLTRSR